MAPRAHWKGYLRLSLVQCPIAVYPATTETEKTRLHQINRKTGPSIRYLKVDAETGEPVDDDDVAMGYEIAKGRYIPISVQELAAIASESKHIIDIDAFVPRQGVDELFHLRPYYIAPDGQAGQDAFVVIRDAIAKMGRIALGRIVLTDREHVVAIERRGKGLLGMLLRYPYEIRKETDYFAGISDLRLPKDLFDLAERIVEARSDHFDPEKFEDRFERALRDLIRRKQKGDSIAAERAARPSNVVNLMEALRSSVEAQAGATRRVRAQHPGRGRPPSGHARRAR